MKKRSSGKSHTLVIVIVAVLVAFGGIAAYIILNIKKPFAPYPEQYRIADKIRTMTMMFSDTNYDELLKYDQLTDEPTRLQAVSAFIRAVNQPGYSYSVESADKYKDLEDNAKKIIEYAYSKGYLDGIATGSKFDPGRKINAQQFMTMVLRALGYDSKKGDFSPGNSLKAANDLGVIGKEKYNFDAGHLFTVEMMYDMIFDMLRSHQKDSLSRFADGQVSARILTVNDIGQFYKTLNSIYVNKYSDNLTVSFLVDPLTYSGLADSSWQNGKFYEYCEGDFEAAYQEIVTSLTAYRSDFLNDNLNRVYVFKKMLFNNSEMGSVHSSQVNSILIGNVESPGTNLHHELAGIFYEKHRSAIDEAEFTKNNPAGFRYIGFEAAFKEKKTSLKLNPSLYKDGFLCDFGKADMMADFMSFAENLFMNKTIFWEAVGANPNLQYKMKYVIGIYGQFYTGYGEDLFKSLPPQ